MALIARRAVVLRRRPAASLPARRSIALRWLRVLTNVKSFHNLHGTGNASGARAETMLFVAT
jgi:hypothetical protein